MVKPRKRKLTQEEVLKYYVGKDSKFEGELCLQLDGWGVRYKYHPERFHYLQPAKKRSYEPDIILLDNGIYLESKGRFSADDRKKHLLVREQYPEMDLRFVLYRANTPINPRSDTTVEDWLTKNNFQYSIGSIPVEWTKEDKTK